MSKKQWKDEYRQLRISRRLICRYFGKAGFALMMRSLNTRASHE